MSSSSARGGRVRPWFWVGLALLLALAVGLVAWHFRQPRGPDMVAVMRANNRGVGHMERFEFPEAVKAFEEVVRLAPDWLPGRINLGIAVMNLSRGLSEADKSAAEARARDLFDGALKRDPNNPYAHYCLGLLVTGQGDVSQFARARDDFEAVARVDPDDAFSWYWLGRTAEDEPEKAVPCYERALACDPYLNAARFSLHGLLRQQGQNDKAKSLLKEFQALTDADWATPLNEGYYTDRGRYARVIGQPEHPDPPRTGPLPVFLHNEQLQVQLAPGARWATGKDFGTGALAELRAEVRRRFGAVLTVLDYNRDGKPDLFLVGAAIQDGKVRDLLLRNDGGNHFTDVTAEAHLDGERASLGCCVADFDNDGYPDLFLTGAGRQHLFRNNQKGGFEDVTDAAGLGDLKTVCLGAAFVDLDQDGDLDLVVAQYADSPEHAVAALRQKGAPAGPGLAVYLNVGEAPPAGEKTKDPPPLKLSFRRADGPAGLLGEPAAVVGLAVSDLDLDHDLDLLVLADGRAPALVLNDRLLQFHRAALPEDQVPTGRWNGALVLDAGHHQRSDLFLVGPDQSPLLLAHQPAGRTTDPGKWFQRQASNSPPLLQAQAIDLDLDGWTDIIGLSAQHRPVLLHNDGQHLTHVPDAVGRDTDWPDDLVAVAAADVDCDGRPDVLAWTEGGGLQFWTSQDNGNHGMKLEITGHRRVDPSGSSDRCNADGFGTRVLAQVGELQASIEYTTLSAGLGQSHQPLVLGFGRQTQADVLRLHWPDLVWQAEFDAAPASGCEVFRVEEFNRKAVSCPLLFAWDGRRFGFVTDFLGAGSVGEAEPGGGHRPPRPEESVKIEPGQLVPRDGQYVLKIAEPMDEVTYLDRLQLVVLDHPADVRVYPDERFSDGPPPSQDLLAFRREIFPARARDHRGRDVTDTLRRWDRDTVCDFARRSWLGYAEEHWVELDFGDRLAGFGPDDRLVLCLAGWTDYPYPESIWAATQAGVPLEAPVLERRGPDGRWQAVGEAGFPAGLTRMMTLDVTGKLTGPSCVVRLRTNMQVYWDQAFVAPVLETVVPGGGGAVRARYLEVETATLAPRGCPKEFSPDGREPTVYDYDRLEAVPVSRLAGRLTRFGDVTELLREADDRFVIFGPGDDLDVRFDARALPELPPGWARSFVLRTGGYCKDAAPFTAAGGTVGPLPFRAMGNYPYGPDRTYPHPDDDRRFNTRPVGRVR